MTTTITRQTEDRTTGTRHILVRMTVLVATVEAIKAWNDLNQRQRDGLLHPYNGIHIRTRRSLVRRGLLNNDGDRTPRGELAAQLGQRT